MKRNTIITLGLALLVVSILLWTCGYLSPETVSSTAEPANQATRVQALAPVPVETLPPIDPERQARDIAEKQRRGIYTFAQAHEVHFTAAESGRWTTLADGRAQWELGLDAPGALSLNFGFSEYHMPDGGRLEILDAAGARPWRAFTAADNEDHRELWTPIVFGDAATLRVTLPAAARSALGLTLAQVNQGFRGLKHIDPEKIGGESTGACNVDVACDAATLPDIGGLIDEHRDQIRSVGAYTIGGVDICTGALIANTALDRRPFFLTASHCNVNSGNAASMVTYWNFENSTCRLPNSAASGGVGDGDLSQFNAGALFRADSPTSDMTLLEMDDPIDPSHNVFFSGWDRSGAVASSVTGIHHPSVAEKRICFDFDPVSLTVYYGTTVDPNGTHIRVGDWDHGTTQGGSSGSPLFDQNRRIIGQLHGGDAACGNDAADWYGRLSKSWDGGGTPASRLSDWLDPVASGATTLDGYNLDESLFVSDGSVVEGDSGTRDITFEVTLDRPSTDPVTVSYQVEALTATEGPDFPGGQTGSLSFPAGTIARSFSVTVNGDTEAEPNETLRVRLFDASGAQFADAQGIGTILNDDFAVAPDINSPLAADAIRNRPFTYQIGATNFPSSFAILGGPDGMVVDAATGLVSWTPSVAGSYVVQIRASNPLGSDTETLGITVAEDPVVLALDNPTLALQPGTTWVVQNTVTHDGVDAMQAGSISDNQTSDLTIDVAGPDELQFWWKVSSEANYDFLQILLDGTVAEQISGEIDWTEQTLTIPTGTHTVTWRYLKDASVSNGDDTAYLDEVRLASQALPPVIAATGSQTGVVATAFNLLMNASGAPTFTASGLPTGLSIGDGGVISGVPTTTGIFTVTVTATNAFGSDTETFTLTILDALADLDTPQLSIQGNQMLIRFPKPADGSGYDYAVERSDHLVPGNWVDSGITVTTDSLTELQATDSIGAAAIRQFYRVRATPK